MIDFRSIAIDEIQPRGVNPRIIFEKQPLDELVASIKAKGVMQPIIVRPKDKGFELVAGERRWRAAKTAGLEEIPCSVRELTDLEADELMVIENAQRVDLNYVEEADAFALLRDTHKLSVKEISAKTGKPVGYINNRLHLVNLSPAVRKAALERNSSLTPGYAALIAKINDHGSQDRFLEEILKGDGSNKPLRLKDAEALLESTYQIALTKASFNTNDADLYVEAGACAACPFNTTNLDRTIYKEKEICTKPTCFKEKEKREFDRLAATAKDEGLIVIPPKKAAPIFDKYWARQGRDDVTHNSGLVNIDEKKYYSDHGHTTLRTVLKGEAMPQLHITRGPSGKTVYLINRKDADAALDKIRRKRAAQESLKSPAKTAAQKKNEQQTLAGKRAAAAAVQKIVDSTQRIGVPDTLKRPLLTLLAGLGGYQHEEELVTALKRREITEVKGRDFTARHNAIKTFFSKHAPKLDATTLLGLLIETVFSQTHYHSYTKFDDKLTTAASLYKIDLTALQRQELKAIQTAEREKAAKKKSKKVRANKTKAK